MKLTDFFKKSVFGLFIEQRKNGQGAFDNIRTDYVLSRCLYASAPAEEAGYINYALGNYCTKPYIDMFSWFIGLPEIQAKSEAFTADIQAFLNRNQDRLLKIYRQTMIDGKLYIWLRLERTLSGKPYINMKQVLLDTVKEDECITDVDGNYKRFVIETVKKWKDGGSDKKAAIRIVLEAGTETISIEGDMPPEYEKRETVNTTAFQFVPVFCLYNNKQPFMQDGIPEIAAAVPFIRRYDATLRKLGKHIDEILDPKMRIRVSNAADFLKNSFGLSSADMSNLEAGRLSIDITQFKAAMMTGETDTLDFITQPNNAESALSLLKLLHWVIVELTMPEYLYGTSLNSTNASVSEQSPVWAKKVEGRRGEYNEFYYWLSGVFYAAKIALAGRDIYASDGGVEAVTVRWAELTAKDDVQVMNALSTFITAMDKAMELALIAPQTAFNTLKTFISIPNDYTTEREAAGAWLKVKLQVEALQERIRSGDIDAADAIAELIGA